MRPPSILLETVKHTYLILSGTKTVEDRDGIEDEEAVCVKKLSEVWGTWVEKWSKEIEHQVNAQPRYESQERSELKNLAQWDFLYFN